MSFANTSVLGKLRAVVASTVSMSAIALFAASMPAHADANCEAGANHLTSANTTTQFFTAFGNALTPPEEGCALCGVLVTANATGMTLSQLNSLGANFEAVDTNGVFGTMTLSGTTVTVTNLGQLLSRTCVSANVSVNATGWDQARIDVLAANITKIDSISGLPAGRTLTVSADGVSGATISGAGSVILNSTAVSGSAVITGISSAVTFPASLSIDAGGVLAAYPEQISGKTLVGAGTVSIVGTVGSNTDITTITAATSVDLDGTAGAAILTGSTLTLTAAQADGKTLSGAGTAAISGNIDANANFTAISSVLSIPGSVSSGATLTITAAQANGRTLGGLGAIYVPADDLTDSANFRGVTTTGFSFSGSIAAGKTLSVNAVQTAGLTVAGAGSVDVLCTSANDTVSGNIDAAVIASGLAGSDSLSSGDGADTLSGGDDNDTLAAGAGNDAIDGGAGSDSAQFGSNLADASFSAYSSTFTVTSALDGADSVTGVETLVFADKTVYVVAADGAYASLNAALAAAPAGSSFFGAALGLDATTPGFTNTATLNAILARCVGGSTFSVNVLGMTAAQLAAVAANTATLGAVAYPPVEVVSAGAPSGYFTTIQAAINFATAGDIVNVAAGTYAETVTISKSLDVRGPNYAVSPNTGSRGPEAILVPSSTNTSTGAVVTITSSGVSFRGFTVDGDNTALPPSGTGLGGAYGLSVDAARCVFLQGNGLNGVTLSKNVAKNSVNGLRIEQTTNYFASGAVAVRSTNIVLDDNLVQDMTGTGIRLGNSMYAKVTNNTVANADNGIAFSSFRISDAGSAADRVISGNTISARFAGIWTNLYSATPYAVSNNVITVAPPMASAATARTAWYGMMYSTVSAPQNFTNQVNLPLVATPEWWTATGNVIDGGALESGATAYGYWLYYVDNNRDTAGVDHFGQISGGSVSNVAFGVMLKNKDTDPATNFGNSAVGAHAAVSGVAFSLNAGGTGFRLIDDASWVTGNPAPLVNKRNVQLAVGSGNSISGGATGVSVSRPTTFAQTDYNPLVSGSLSDLALSGQSGDYITLASPSAVDATSASFGGSTGAVADDAGNFAIAAKITDKLDTASLGRVTVKANNLFVNSSNTVTAAMAMVSAGETVSVQAGAYADGAVTVNANNLTVNSAAGATGYSLVLGSAANIALAGAGDLNATGNALANSITANAGINAIDGSTGVDTATFAGNAPASLSQGSTIAVGDDSVTNVEKLVFADAAIVLVGTGGSEYGDLNAALAATTTERLFGVLSVNKNSFTDAAGLAAIQARIVGGSTLTVDATGMNAVQLTAIATQIPGNVSNVTLTSEIAAADITSILAQTSGAIVDMAGMSRAQTAAVNGSLNKVATVNNSKVRITRAAAVVHYNLYVDDACAAAQAGDVVNADAGTYALASRIFVTGYSLVGSGSGSVVGGVVTGGTILDMSAVTMANNHAGIQILNSGSVLRDFALTSPTRTGSSGQGFSIAGSGAQGNPDSVSRNATIQNVRIHNVQRTAFDMNTLVDSAITDVSVSSVAGGYGMAFSGASSNVSVTNLSVSGAAWGDVGAYPSPASSTNVPTGISFGGTLGITAINIQPYANTMTVSSGVNGDFGYSAGANILVPAAFNRSVTTTRTAVSNGATLAMNLVTRQADAAAVAASLVNSAAFTFSTPVTSNILGPVEQVRGGVALAGRAVLNGGFNALLASGDVVQMNVATTGGTIAMGDTVLASGVSIAGTFTIGSTGFSSTAAFNALVDASSGATRTVDVLDMSADQIAAVAGKVDAVLVANIVNSIYAVNTATAANFDNAFAVSGITPDAAYTALAAGREASTRADMVSNRGTGYADVTAADALFNKLVAFRTAQEAVIDGSDLGDSDFIVGGRYTAVVAAVGALPAGTSLDGETSSVYGSSAVSTSFNALVAGGRGRTTVLASMNADANDDSISSMNDAFNASLATGQAYDALDAGLTSANDAANITYLLGFATDNSVAVNASGMQTDQLSALAAGIAKINAISGLALSNAQTGPEMIALFSKATGVLVDASSMDPAKLSILAAQYERIASNGITGTFTITNAVTGLSNLFSRIASAATVTVDMAGMGSGTIAIVNANFSLVDFFTNAPVTIARGGSPVGRAPGIQLGIDWATAGDVVSVAAGTYAEDLVIAKSLSLRGPNYGVNPNTAARGAEAVIVPASNLHGGPGVASGKLIQVLANDISVDGFTLDGDNPAVSGGFAYGGVDSNCARALHNQDSAGNSVHVNGIDMSHNIVRNFTTTGYYLLKNGTLPNSSGNYVRNNLFQTMRFRAIYAQGEYELVVTGNVMDQVHVGVAVSSVGTTAAAGFQPRISNNTINLTTFGGTARHMGISVNHRFGTSVRMLVENNTVSADASLVNPGEGLRITSMVFGGSTHATDNVFNCGGTLTTGLWLWNNDGQGETLVSGGAFTNAKTNGLYLTDFDAAYNANSYSTGNFGTVRGTAISTIAGGTAANVHWTGTGSNLGPCVLTLEQSAGLGGAGTGIAMNGAKARVTFSGASPASLSSDLASYIVLSNSGATNPATEIDATAVSFAAVTGDTATLAANYDIEDKVSHKLDDGSLGLVRVKASNLFVSATGNIGRGVSAASVGDTVNVEAGSYTENISLNKRIALVGAGNGETGTVLSSSTTATPVISVTGSGLDAANQLVIKDVRVTGAANASGSDGIAVYGDTPAAFIKVDGVHVTGHGQGVHYRSGTISNATVANSTFHANNFGVRVATAVTSMDGMTIDGCTMTEQTSSAISTNPSGSQTVVNTNFTVSNSTFTNNSRAGVANQHDLSFFGFRGNASLSNVTVTSGNGTAANSNSYGIVFTNASGSAALGTVSLSNVTVQGHVGKGALTFQLYNDISGVTLSGVNLRNCVAPWGDLVLSHTDTDAFAVGNTSLKSVVLWTTGRADATGASFFAPGASSAYDRSVPADNFSIANQVVDIVDQAGLGLVRTTAGKIYVSATAAAGALERAIGAASSGDEIVVQDGAAFVLTAEITKTVTFSGNFTVTAASIPTGASATAVLSSFTARLAPGSTLGANLAGMTAAQVAAVNANFASINATVAGAKVTVTRGASTVAYTLLVQQAIDLAAAGDIVNVAAGTYAEQLAVSKSLTLRGPNASKAGTDATRVAEAVIQPPASMRATAAGTSYLVEVLADDVVIEGLSIDGDNPSSASPYTANGANPDCDEAITVYLADGVVIRNNIVRNAFWFGITLGASDAGTMYGQVTGNKVENVPYFAGILAYDHYYARIENNSITNAWRGIQTNNHAYAAPAGAVASISNNTITTGVQDIAGDGTYTDYDGILHNLQYGSATAWTIAGNTITNASGANVDPDCDGIEVWSIQGSVGATIADNTIAGFPNGYTLWNCPTTTGVSVSGGSVTGAVNGVVATNHDNFGNAASSSYSISNLTISGCSVGVLVNDSALNTNGSSVSVSIIGGALPGGAVVSGVGLLVSGADASVPALSAAFSDQLASYIALSGNSNAIDATAATFGGSTGAAAGDAANFAIAAKITDKLDSASLGRVTVKANNLFVNSSNSVAAAMAMVSAGETVNVQAGAYADGAVTVNANNLTVNSAAGATGYSLILGSASNIVLAGLGDLNVTGNGSANAMTANAGINAIDGAAGIDTATFAGNAPASLAQGSTIAVGDDSVTNVEKLVFADAAIVLVGTGGSAYGDLNTALAATTTERLFGVLAINSSTFATSAQLDAITTRFMSGSSVSVDVLGMNATQLAAVAANATASGVVVYPPVQVVNAASEITGYFNTIQSAIDSASTAAGSVVNISAGTYAEELWVTKGLTLRGPNAAKSGTDATRGAEAIIQFPASAANGAVLVYGDADGIALEGLDLRSQDSRITGAGSYSYLWFSYAQNNLTFRNNRMYGGEIPVYIYPAAAPKSGLLISGNYIDGGPFVNSSYGRGLYLAHIAGTIENNTIVNVATAIQYSPQANPVPGTIRGNTVSASVVGLYDNVHNATGAAVTWENNIVTVASNDRAGLKALVDGAYTATKPFSGIMVRTFGVDYTGTGVPASSSFSGNSIDCALTSGVTYNSTVLEAVNFTAPHAAGIATFSGNSFLNWTVAVQDNVGASYEMGCNWWGTADANALAAAIPGNLRFSPYRASSSDAACTGEGAVVLVGKGRSYSTIMAAHNASATVAGDALAVAAGTYNEVLDITKSVALRGANFGVNAVSGARGAESVIAYSGNYAVQVGAANVSIDGFTITNAAGSAVRVMGSAAAGGNVSGASIANNILSGVAIGTGSGSDVSGVVNLGISAGHVANGFAVTNNAITATGTIAGGNGAIGVRLGNTGGDLSGTVSISGNRMSGPGASATASAGVFANTDAADLTLADNTVAGFAAGFQFQGSSKPSVSGNLFAIGTTYNTNDVLFQNGTAGFTLGANQYWATSNAIFAGTTGMGADISGTVGSTFRGVTLDAESTSLAQLFAIEDQIGHKIERSARGFIRVKADEVFVTIAGLANAAGASPAQNALYNAVAAADDGDIIRVESGAAIVLTTEITKAVTFSGSFAINAANIPSDATATAVLSSFMTRLASNATASADLTGMNASQIAAVNANLARFGTFAGNPVAVVRGGAPVAYYTTIQTGIDGASAGDTVTVAPGTYTERLSIAKRITLEGAGSGSDPLVDTIIASVDSTEANIMVTPGASGTSPTDRLVFRSLRLIGATGAGNAGTGVRLRSDASVLRHVTFDDVAAAGNTGYGIVLEGNQATASVAGTGVLEDIVIDGCVFTGNNIGVRVASSANILDGLAIVDSEFTANTAFGFQVNANDYDSNNTNISITDSVFNGNGTSGYASASRVGDISILGFNGNLAMSGVTVNGITGSSPANLGISISGFGSTTVAPVDAGTMTFTNVTVNGKFAHPSLAANNPGGQGRAFGIKSYAGVSGVSFSNVSIDNTYGNSLELFGITGTMNLAGISFGVPTTDAFGTGAEPAALPAGSNHGTRTAYSIVTGMGTNLATGKSPVNAAGATFSGLVTSADAGRFSAQSRLLDAIDGTDRGLVTLLAGNVYVPAGGIIANGIAAAASGDTVNLAPATFTENVSIAKRIALSGAGSGAGGTALVSAAGTGTPVISVTGSGINGDNQLTIKNLSMAGTSNTSGSDAIAVYGDAPVSFVKVDNVNISAHGVAVHYRSGTVTNATVSNSTLSGNGIAVRVASAVTTMDGMTIDGCTMNNNNSAAISTNPSGTLSNINTNFTVSNSTFANNSTAGVANQHDLSFFGFRGNATLQNVTVTSGNGTSQNSNSHGVVFTGSSGFQTLGTVVLDNVTVQGHVGKNAMTFQAYADVSGVSMNNVSLQNCVTGWGVDLTVSSNGAAPLDIGNTRLKTVGAWNASGVDAEDAVFYTAGGSVLNRSVLADNYTISSQIKSDAIDLAGLGLVRTDANDLYVSLLSFASPLSTLSGALERAITASRTGDTINVENGVPVVLTAPITKSILFAGNFLITSSSIPTGSSATAVLSSFVSRVAAGSTIAVNATGMTTDQLAAVAAAMPGNVDNLVITAADAPADITALLAQAVVGAEYPRVEMAGMSRDQTAAVNGSLNKVAVVNGSKVRVARGASTVHYDLYVDPAAAAAQAGDVMTVDAGSYALLQKIEVDGWSLVGAGSALVTIDMSAAPMNTAQGSREQGILLSGDGASVSGFTLTSPTRTASTGSAYGIKSGGTNIAISDVAVNNVALSAVDLNGAVGGTIDGLSVNGVSGGYGLAISGSTSDITVSNITVLNAAWGEVAAYPYLAGVPSDIEFTTGLNINAITIQPATSSLSATVPAGNAYHSASAGVKVPAAFNRQIGLPTNGVSVTRLVTRQGSVAGIQAYLVTVGVPLAAQTVTNILGPAEQVRGGVALAGVSVLDDAFAASLAAGDVVQMNLATTGGTIALTTAFPATSSIVGTFTLTSTSYPNATTLDAILAASGTASRTVVMTSTNATQTAAVAAQVDAIGLGNIQDALYPINAAASGAEMTNSLTVAGIIPNAEYNALTSGRKAAVATDTQANRPSAGYASVAATGELCGQVTHFRTAQQPIIDGTSLVAADFGSSGRYTALVAAVDGLTAGTTLTGETASVYNSSTVASQFAALVDGGRGEAYVLAAMNSNDSSISSMNDAFAASLETAQAYDALDAGITSANSASNITYLFGFATANSVAVNASGMDDGQLGAVSNGIGFVSAITNLSLASTENATEIGNLLSKTSGALASATGMDQGQLSALGAGASAIAGNGITGTLLVDKTVTSLNALLGKTAAGATVNVNASLMSDAYLTILSGNISKIDEITSLALTSAQSAEEIANLLTEAVAAVADATGMDQPKLSNLGAAAPAIADNGVTGTLAIESTIENLNALLGKTAAGATVNVNAASMSDANLTVLSGQIAKVDEITSLALTSAQSAEEIANLLTEAVAAVANATGMDEAKLSNLGAAAPAIAANGVTGTMLVNKDVTSLNALLGKTAAGATVNVNASTMSNAYLTILSGNISKIDEITSLALTSTQSAEEIANLLTEAVAAIANGTGMDQSKLGNLGAGASAIAANGITGTLAIDSTVANLDALLGKTSDALATVNVDASGFDGEGKGVLASNGTKIDSIVDLALADSEDASEIAVLLSKVAAESAVVDATDMDYTQFNAIAAAIGKISDDGISGTFTLTKDTIQVGAILAKTQLAAVVTVNANEMTSTQLDEVGANIAKVDFLINVTVTADASLSIESLEDLMSSSTDVNVIATGMSAAQLNVVAEYAANVAANGITGDMFLTSEVLDSTLAALLGKTAASAVVTADATGMSSVHKDAMAANIGKVDKIYDLALASSESADEITALLTKSVAVAAAGEAMAVANATGMDDLQLNALGASFAKLGADGITGAVALVSDVTDANLTNLFVKIALAADVRVDGTGMGASTLAILSANNAKVDSAFDYALTSSQNASQLSNLLGKSDVASATAVATGMDSVAGGQLATLADNHLKIRANGITGSVSITADLTPTQLTNLLGRIDLSGSSFTGGTTVTIDAQGMSNSQLTSIASAIAGAGNTANQAAVFDIYNLSLTSAQSSSQLATLLNATVPGEASVNASSMSSAQLAALGNAPAAIDLITGSFTITADLTAAQIAAIMGNVSTTAVPTIDPTGMSPDQQNAVYSNALLVARTSSVVTTGNTFVVEVNVSGLAQFAVGAQVRVVYDSSRLAFVADPDGNGEPNYGGTDMPTQIFMSQTSNSVTFATGVDIEGDGVGVKTGNAARLTFRATVPFCPDDNLVWLSTSGFTNRLTTADAVPQSIPFTATNFVRIGSLNNLQLTGTPSGNSDVAADAGTVLGAAFTEPTVTAANSCSAVSVVRTITLPGGSTPTSWPSHFPVGVTSVNWTSTDEAGNVASNTTTYTVQNYQLATADVNLIATINPATSFNQVMRVRMSSGDVVSATVAFAGNDGAVMDIQVPIRDDYTCMAIKDAAHTLTDVQSLSVSGTKYATSGIYELVSGDANDDDLVDILDFGAFVADRGAGKTPASRSNYNRDIFVNSADYSYIGINFLQMGDVCGSGYNGGAPLTRITVKELRRRGLGEFAVADVNHDGWVDEEDLALVMSGQVPGFTPADEPTIHEDTAW